MSARTTFQNLKRKDKDIAKLCGYARKVKKPLDDIVRVLMAEE